MSPITTHVLDTALGRPAEGIQITLYYCDEEGNTKRVGGGVTNTDGRNTDLMPGAAAREGHYRIVFETAEYFSSSNRDSFYPRVEVLFRVEGNAGHYHVPLLISPFGYSTYRGS